MMQRARFASLLLLFAAMAVVHVGARGQCATQWVSGPPLAGCDTTVTALTEWDPDGAGPRPPVLVLGGVFTTAGSAPANRVVAFDPATATWATLGSGITGDFGSGVARVHALAVLPNGDLVAGGAFTTAGGVPASCIARWDGVAWSPLGSGVDDAVLALHVLPNGDLVAGGRFTSAGGVPAQKAARWNGVAWSAFGSGPGTNPGDAVFALTARNGDLIAACTLWPTGSSTNPLRRWNGTAWVPLGAGIAGVVEALAALPNGDLLAAGSLSLGGATVSQGMLRWNGTIWSTFGSGLGSWVKALRVLATGEVVAVGLDGQVARGNGGTWSTIGTTTYPGHGLAVAQLANGMVVVGGTFTMIDGFRLDCVGAWNGASWSPLGAPAGPLTTSAATCLPNGDIVVADSTYIDGGVRIRRWNGATWSQLGGTFDAGVRGLVTAANGDLIACGSFTAIGGLPAARVARWNGTAWQPFGSGMDGRVDAMRELANGDIVAVGSFASAGGVPANGVARWNGASWSSLATGLNGEGYTVVEAANGDVLAGGSAAPSSVMRWNGTSWHAVGALLGQVHSLAVLPNGDVVAGGTNLAVGSVPTHHVARWNGAAWLPLGSGLSLAFGYVPGASLVEVRGVVALPGGDVIAVGTFTGAGGAPARGAARWNGTTWTPLATMGSGFPQSVAHAPNGDLVLSGVTRMDDVVSAGFARLTTTCPATTSASAPGCAGNTLATTDLPWTGATFEAHASGLPATSIALGVFGFATASIPLAAVLPQGGAGCVLSVNPDLLTTVVPSGGTATTQLAIPNSVVLAGVVVHEQVLALGLGAGGAFTTFTGTNRLSLTIGSF